MPQTPSAEFELASSGMLVLVPPTYSPMSHQATLLDVVLFPGEPLRVGDRRRGVRHVEHRREAAEHRGLGAGGDGFHRLVAGIAQMHVRVDQAGQHVQAARVDGFVRRGVGSDAERGDAPVAHADIGGLDAPGQHAGAVADQQVEMAGMADSSWAMPSTGCH